MRKPTQLPSYCDDLPTVVARAHNRLLSIIHVRFVLST